MAGIIKYLETGSVDPGYNLAFEEHVLLNRRDAPYLMLWQNDNAVVIGQNQNTEAEVDQHFIREHGIRVVRRTTGGGAVYHDLGNLNYSFIADAKDAGQLTMERFTLPVVDALCSLGLDAVVSGRNDISIEGRKVSGTAQRLAEGRVLHHGTLLFDSNPSMLAGALRVDPQKFRAKRAKSVRSRVGNIHDFLLREGKDMTLSEFWNHLKKTLAGDDLVPDKLDTWELERVRHLKEERYDSWEWVYGRSPAYDLCNRRWWDGGELEVRASIKRGRVSDIRFFGDFLAVLPLTALTEELIGCPYRREAFRRVLEEHPIKELFGGITMEEVLSTVFPL